MNLKLPNIPKTNLENITLVCADTNHPQAGLNSLTICRHFCNFKKTIFFTNCPPVNRDGDIEIVHIAELKSREDYSRFMMQQLYKWIGTSHVLTCQWDGMICNPPPPNLDLCEYDFIGSTFHHKLTKSNVVGNSGFCLRSKRFLERCSRLPDKMRPFFDDTVPLITYRKEFEAEGFKIAPWEVAVIFANGIYTHVPGDPTFGFHDFNYSDPLGIKDCQRRNEEITIVPTEELTDEHIYLSEDESNIPDLIV